MKTILRLGLTIALLFCGFCDRVDADERVLKRSIAVVFDLSYSMATIDRGTDVSRYELGARAVEQLWNDAGGGEEWSLIIADDAGAAEAAGGFTTDLQSLIPVLREAEPWGTTSVDQMILAGAEEFSHAAGGTKRFLLLVTDGINTHEQLYRLREFELDARLNATPVVLGFSVAEHADYPGKVSDWITASGGVFLFYHQIDELRRILDNGEMQRLERTAEKTEKTEETKETIAEAEPASRTTAGTTVLFPVWWIFAIPALVLLVIILYRFRRWSFQRRVARSKKAESREAITIAYSVHGGAEENRTLQTFPVRVGAGGKVDLLLENPRISSGARSFEIVRDEEGFKFSATGMFIINGVGRTTHVLSGGDRITFGRYRLIFKGTSRLSTAPPAVSKPRFLFLVLPLLLFAVSAVVFREPVAMGGRLATAGDSEAAAQIGYETGAQEAFARRSNAAVVFTEEPGILEIDTFPTVMWSPGVKPDLYKIDVLLFHAHPDDETLDFGVLLRRLADAGKRTAVVLFTDGESGLDQYPRRFTGEDYPSYRLQGPALADLRAHEARSAMSILGVSHYVRLGLKNNSYAGTSDVLSTRAVIAAWGGEETLLQTLSSLISGYEPDVVVSPDGPAEALEHFEHETVGLLVEAALEKLKQNGVYEPRGRLISVDPLQKELYPDAEGVSATGAHGTSDLSYRAIQAVALAEHHTQRDASVVGVENLSGFDKEYYRILSWEFPFSIEEYLRHR